MKQPKLPGKDFKLVMKKRLLSTLLFVPLFALSQKTVVVDSTDPGFRTVIPGAEYKAGGFYEFLWGKHYRDEWTTPVKVPVVNLDTIFGGLTAIEQGGGRQTKTLRLQTKNGKQYVLRSIDKDYSAILPDVVKGTFIENLAKDAVSTAHPFASVTVPVMIEAAGVYHTNPRIVYVPYTPSLGKYNETFAGLLCLLEERPAGNQEDAANFGFSEDVKGTEKMFHKLFTESDHRVDQNAFVKARLFDMFLGDWGRHDDQWRWAEFDSADYKIYKPIPRDRDQAYTKFDGLIVKKVTGVENLEHLQTFSGDIKNVKKFNFPARYIDRQLTNEVPRQNWIDAAKQLQQALTDEVIEKSIHQLPPELYAISGDKMVGYLKSRRGHLVEYAEKYYTFLTKIVEIVGTEDSEFFSITRNDKETQVSLFDLNKEGQPKKHPFYSRTFFTSETNEIRLYGLKGNDVYHIDGTSNSIKIRVIGGTDKDSIVNNSSPAKLKYYDNKDNIIVGNVRSRLKNDTAINRYDYNAFKYNSGNTIKGVTYSNERGVYLHAGYTYTKQKFRKDPFAWQQTFKVNYSPGNKSWGADYNAIFNQVIGRWNLVLNGSIDQQLKNYFWGIGNETVYEKSIKYYDLHTNEAIGNLGLNRSFGRFNNLTVSGFFQNIKVKDEADKYSANLLPSDPSIYNRKNFAGAQILYDFHHLDDVQLPTRGFALLAMASQTFNLTDKNESFQRYSGEVGLYQPFSKKVSIGIRAGGATLGGDTPEFYQLNWLGGRQNLRGFHRQRFYGKTTFYNNNELRWITNIKGRMYSGRFGIVGFFDEGRLWQPGETSDLWHIGYGGGIVLSPFNRLTLTVLYGISKEDQLIHLKFGFL